MRASLIPGVVALVVAMAVGCAQTEPAAAPSPTPSPTATATPAPTPTPTPEPTLTPIPPPARSAQEILDSTSAAMRGLTTFHFDMDMLVTLTTQGVTLDVPLTFVGDFQAPDRLKADMSLTIAFFAIETEIVSIGDATYTRDPDTGEWDVTVGEDAFIISPAEFMGEGVSDLNDLVYVGVSTLEDRSMFRLQGTSVTGALTESVSDLVLSFWIGVDDGLLAQVKAEGKFEIGEDDPLFGDIAAGTGNVSLTVRFSDFGAPVSIEPPDLEAPPPAPTPTPPPVGVTDDVVALRRLALDYWAAFNAYDEEKVLSYLEEDYRAERESEIRRDIGQLRTFNVKLGVSEKSAPRLVSADLGEMTLELKEPLGTRTILVAFIKVDGEWKIAFAEEVK